jgi:hypothetical protein
MAEQTTHIKRYGSLFMLPSPSPAFFISFYANHQSQIFKQSQMKKTFLLALLCLLSFSFSCSKNKERELIALESNGQWFKENLPISLERITFFLTVLLIHTGNQKGLCSQRRSSG